MQILRGLARFPDCCHVSEGPHLFHDGTAGYVLVGDCHAAFSRRGRTRRATISRDLCHDRQYRELEDNEKDEDDDSHETSFMRSGVKQNCDFVYPPNAWVLDYKWRNRWVVGQSTHYQPLRWLLAPALMPPIVFCAPVVPWSLCRTCHDTFV